MPKAAFEKHIEVNLNICLAFVDLQKAFESVEHRAIKHAGLDYRYTQLVQHIYDNAA